jgi:DNA-directed RNA polymerase specialized sigma subunit
VKKLPQHYKDKVKKEMTVMTTQEVADKLGVSKAAVIQMERKALTKARKIIDARMKKQDILPD